MSSSTGVLKAAAAAIDRGDLEAAEKLLEPHLLRHADDVRGIELLAEIAAQQRRYNVAVNLLLHGLSIAPDDVAARQRLANVYLRAQRPSEALAEIDALLCRHPDNGDARRLRAAALARTGDYEGAARYLQALLVERKDDPQVWLDYGAALIKLGRTEDGVTAVRASLARRPSSADAWWSLASLKTEPLSDEDIAQVRLTLRDPDQTAVQRALLHYTLGKGFEDRRRFQDSFTNYVEGARLVRATRSYDPLTIEDHVRRCKDVFTTKLLAASEAAAASASGPIFIVGLPRSGSTLIEQILASHPLIEGAGELSILGDIAKRLGQRHTRAQVSKYPEVLVGAHARQLTELGESYLNGVRAFGHASKPMFTDKMPSNFLHIGLILLALPNAKIIDARRHPMATCFSAFKQYFTNGQSFTYDLHELGRYYRAYLDLMAHFDRVAPGRIHRVFYEDMISNTESEVRRLLSHCGVGFEVACLRFFETARVARTSSSEQVKRPIFTDAVDHWRNYEPWLGPLKQALGSAASAYPDVPPELA